MLRLCCSCFCYRVCLMYFLYFAFHVWRSCFLCAAQYLMLIGITLLSCVFQRSCTCELWSIKIFPSVKRLFLFFNEDLAMKVIKHGQLHIKSWVSLINLFVCFTTQSLLGFLCIITPVSVRLKKLLPSHSPLHSLFFVWC